MNSNIKLLDLFEKARDAEFNEESVNNLEQAIKDNIREECSASLGKKDELKVIQKLMKFNAKVFKEEYIGFFEYHGRYVFLSPNMLVISIIDHGYDEAPGLINFETFIPKSTCHKMELDVAELKAAVKIAKAKKNTPIYIHTMENGLACPINAELALDAIKFSGTNVFEFSNSIGIDPKQNISPYVQYNERGEVITMVLPIRLKKIKKKEE